MSLKKIAVILCCLVPGLMTGCKPDKDQKPENKNFAKGADISWLTEMEAAGKKFHNSSGAEQDCMQILKDKGINSVRIRAWVNPTDGWNNTADVVSKAIRAKALGMKIMIDLHYSDTWADPGHQLKPAAWSAFDIEELKNAVSVYTTDVMTSLSQNGITPDWVQVGNETNDGMLWNEGRASTNMANFAALINAGSTAVKAVSNSTKVIVHVSNGYDNSLFRWMFDGLTQHAASFDIIGMSLYPSYSGSDWSEIDNQCLFNMNDMVIRYGKPVMIVEVGMPENDPSASKAFLSDIISKTRTVTGGNGLGVFYWEPESSNGWKSYGLGAFDDTGKPTAAMDAFLE